ncbi:MAG: PAS domain S-box protein [Rhodospirillaceae bacterium]
MSKITSPSGEAPRTPLAISPSVDLPRALDHLPFPVGLFTLEGRIIFINLAPLSESGQVASDVVGKFLWEAAWFDHSEELRNDVRDILSRAAAGEKVQRELRARFGSDDFRSFGCEFAPLRDANGTAVGIIASAMDVTGQKGRDQQLQRSQLLLEGIVEHLPVIIFVKHAPDLRFSLINRTAEEILGYPREQLIGKSDHELWTPEQANGFVEVDREVLASPHVKKIDLEPVRTAAGETRLLRTWKVALRDANGTPEYLLGISIDVTEEIATLEALRISAEKLTGLYEMAPVGIALTDASGKYVEYNDAFREICGYPDAELKSLDYWKLTPPEYFEQEQLQLKSLATSNRYGPYEKEYVQKSGKRIPIRLRGITVHGAGGQQYTWSIVEDITEQKATDEALRQAQKMKAVGQLTAGVAHDFNNLLAVVSGSLEMLLAEGDVTPRIQRLANMALAATKRGGELTQHLLAYGRKQHLNVSVHNLGNCIESVARWLKRTLPANIKIVTEGTTSFLQTLIDEAQLENSLLNLSLNARDAMPGGGTLTFELAAVTVEKETPVYGGKLAPGEYAKISVRDTGCGMPPEVLREAFDPFFTTKSAGQGSGMGLSMVYGFVRQSGGRIAVTSDVGKGTVFEIYFPVAAAAPETATSEPAARTSTTAARQLRVLVVEDIADVRDTVCLQIEAFGHTVDAVADGESALEALNRETYDVLITDLGLPGKITGVDVALAGATWPHLKVITMSGYNEGLAAIQQSPLAKGTVHLRKPFETAELRRHIEAAATRGAG